MCLSVNLSSSIIHLHFFIPCLSTQVTMMALSLSSFFSTLVSILLLLQSTTHAARHNDWSKPCFHGECFYDLPAHSGKASGSLKIWGSLDAITDITAAAGWTILGCSPDALVQDIRLVCNSDDTGNSGCAHLHRKAGAVGKIVRLPENCGKSAFARISKAWVSKDQSIPKDVARRLVRRRGAQPQVHALALDADFAAVDPATNGEVSIAIQGSTVPGAEGNLTVTPSSSRHDRRGPSSFIDDAFNYFNSFDESATKALPPVEVSKSFPFFSESIPCDGPPAFNATMKADVDTNAHTVITLGVAAAGTIVPPKLTEFGLFTGMDGTFGGTLDFKGHVTAKVETSVTFLQVGILGLDFPGLLTIDPSFKILGQVSATLDVNLELKLDLSYTVNGAKLFFPPSPNHPSGGSFSSGNAPLKLSVSPSVASKTVVAAHLIPRFDVAISALGGIAEATFFVDFDASGFATLTLNAAATGVGIDPATGAVSPSESASLDGCISAGTGLHVVAGADGSFFDLIDVSTEIPLFVVDFELFKKCFGVGTQKRAVSGHPELMPHRRELSMSCPVPSENPLVAVA
ncbi:hypothetical protein D9615_010015 [Tricholomella constricta]|uniref:Uncharacterized protein n=1 Tax=Tricholomella constricta TaxID=117010 RepID=A0A8H5LV00_9AGAR|nr:hypothetical protein D9615_010015 [Tricholomella constricta]